MRGEIRARDGDKKAGWTDDGDHLVGTIVTILVAKGVEKKKEKGLEGVSVKAKEKIKEVNEK